MPLTCWFLTLAKAVIFPACRSSKELLERIWPLTQRKGQKPVQKQMPVSRPHLDPARDEVVRGGEYELLGTGCLRGSQDHLPSSSSIWAGQDELLLGGPGGVHCGDYLDLLSCLLVCHNLQDTTRRLLSRSVTRLVYLQAVRKAVTAQCRPGVNAGPRCSFTSAW